MRQYGLSSCLSRRMGHRLGRDELVRIVAQSDKRRFTLSGDGERVRAAQGHVLWQADNGVWLTDHVAPARLGLASGEERE